MTHWHVWDCSCLLSSISRVRFPGESLMIIKLCKHHGETDFVKSGNHYRCKKCRVISVTKRRRKVKTLLIQEFGGKCKVCGYDKCQEALQFHHLNPSNKEFGISKEGVTRSYDKALTEARKCILVCANCHFEIENRIINL